MAMPVTHLRARWTSCFMTLSRVLGSSSSSLEKRWGWVMRIVRGIECFYWMSQRKGVPGLLFKQTASGPLGLKALAPLDARSIGT